MKAIWYTKDHSFDYYILAGDIGGTNTNLAIVGKRNGGFNLVLECVFDSHTQVSLSQPVRDILAHGGPELRPVKCCISAAGPVKHNYCQLTNQSWNIDGNALSREFGIPVLVINDFLGLSYGIPLLDTKNPDSITKLPNIRGGFGEKHGDTCCIVGAGTGLGVGCVTGTASSLFAIPTEGGHVDFAAFDAESEELVQFLKETYGGYPDAESLVSGQGLNNIFDFHLKNRIQNPDSLVQEIAAVPRKDRPPLISRGCNDSRQLRAIMELFVKCYGRVASNCSLSYLSTGGVYLAGGIAAKNEQLFIENNIFMNCFVQNMRPHFQKLLESIPVYIVRDYNTSLLGAANAADLLL